MENYDKNPALRPTILIQAVLENVYRSPRELAATARPRVDATEPRVARDTPRAA